MNNFTMVSNTIISNKNISLGAFRLYCILNSYCYGHKNTCFPSQKTLAEQMKKSVRTIQRYLKELMKNGIVKIMRRGSTSNLYQLLRNAADKAKAYNPSLFEKPANKKNNKNSNVQSFGKPPSAKREMLNIILKKLNLEEKYEDHFFSDEEMDFIIKRYNSLLVK